MKFSDDERRLIELKRLADDLGDSDGGDFRAACRSMIQWFMRKGEWTPKQRWWIDTYVMH